MRGRLLFFLLLVFGCIADLKRVHTPDLLTLNEKHGPIEHCSSLAQRPVIPPGFRHCWRIYSSLEEPGLMIDDSMESVSIAADPFRKDQWILVDLGSLQQVQQVIQIHQFEDGYPRKFRIDVAGDHNFPYSLVFVGTGHPGSSVATFAKPVECRFLRITLLEPCEQAWQVSDLLIL